MISVTLFLQGYSCLSCSIQRFIISLSFDHRREPLIRRAYPPIVPIADEVSPDKGFQFPYVHFLSMITSVEEFLFHPRPHALASCIVMASSPRTVHALKNSVLMDSLMILSRLVDTFSSRILYPMLLLSGNHSIAAVLSWEEDLH